MIRTARLPRTAAWLLIGCLAACATPPSAPPTPAPRPVQPEPVPEPPADESPQIQPIVAEPLGESAEATPGQRMIDDYALRIRRKIAGHIVTKKGAKGRAAAEFAVRLLPGGKVDGVKLKRSSGSSAYDKAVARAIRLASPLPVPADPALFEAFRSLELKFRPN